MIKRYGYVKIVPPPDHQPGLPMAAFGTKVVAVSPDGIEVEIPGVRNITLEFRPDDVVSATLEIVSLDLPPDLRAIVDDIIVCKVSAQEDHKLQRMRDAAERAAKAEIRRQIHHGIEKIIQTHKETRHGAK